MKPVDCGGNESASGATACRSVGQREVVGHEARRLNRIRRLADALLQGRLPARTVLVGRHRLIHMGNWHESVAPTNEETDATGRSPSGSALEELCRSKAERVALSLGARPANECPFVCKNDRAKQCGAMLLLEF